MLVRSAIKMVSVTAILNPCISTTGGYEVFIESFIKKTGCDWSH